MARIPQLLALALLVAVSFSDVEMLDDVHRAARFQSALRSPSSLIWLMLVPQKCENSPTCTDLSRFWDMVGGHIPHSQGFLYKGTCDRTIKSFDHHLPCHLLSDSDSAPLFLRWSGAIGRWSPYNGQKDPESLFQAVHDDASRRSPTVSVDFAGDSSDIQPQQKITPKTRSPKKLHGGMQVWEGQALPAKIFMPVSSEEPRPVLVYLHGTPPSGPFNLGDGENSLHGLLAGNATFAASFPFITLFPCSACTRSGQPLSVSGGPPVHGDIGWTPENFARIEAMVSVLLRENGADSRRVFLTGVSYGGRGVWDFGTFRPSMFAALVPICPAAQPSSQALARLCCSTSASCCPPIWAFHGANDIRAAVELTDMWVRALRGQAWRGRWGAEAEVKYSRYPEAPPLEGKWTGHGANELAFRDEALYAWLLAKECQECDPGRSLP
jgi:poly(3-hydroxybutyrate) depolymerase